MAGCGEKVSGRSEAVDSNTIDSKTVDIKTIGKNAIPGVI